LKNAARRIESSFELESSNVIERYYLVRSFSSFFLILAAATMAHAWTAPGMDALFDVGLVCLTVALVVFIRAHRLLRATLIEEVAIRDDAADPDEMADERFDRVDRAMRYEGASPYPSPFGSERKTS